MKATYDRKTDSLTVILQENATIVESDEDKPGVILDYDVKGNLVSLEIRLGFAVQDSHRIVDAESGVFPTEELDREVLGQQIPAR